MSVLGDGGHTVRDVTLTGTGRAGIFIVNFGNRIERNSIDNCSAGIWVNLQVLPDPLAPDNRLIGNHIDAGIQGIILSTDSTTVIDNVVTGMTGEGIAVFSNENAIRANRLSGNEVGILVFSGAQSNALTGNNATGNTDTDLVDENAGCDDNQWRGNTVDTAAPEDCID